jgi:pimeloyl-ACP methyl ester carboxylesterase
MNSVIYPRGSWLLVSAALLFFTIIHAFSATGKCDGIFYEAKGKGPVLIFLHGGQMDRRVWDAQFDAFAKDHHVIRCDIRGFGKSDAPVKPYSDYEDVRTVMDHLRIKKATLVGLSLGAAIAMEFSLVHPDRVEALVLIGPGLGGFRFTDKANDLRSVVDAARAEDDERVADLWLTNAYVSVAMENPALRGKLRQLAKENARAWLNNPLLIRHLQPPAAERLHDIRAPTLVIGGDRDVSDIIKIVDKLSAEIPGAKKRILPGVGHLPPLEKPEEVIGMMHEFLGRGLH